MRNEPNLRISRIRRLLLKRRRFSIWIVGEGLHFRGLAVLSESRLWPINDLFFRVYRLGSIGDLAWHCFRLGSRPPRGTNATDDDSHDHQRYDYEYGGQLNSHERTKKGRKKDLRKMRFTEDKNAVVIPVYILRGGTTMTAMTKKMSRRDFSAQKTVRT